MEPTPSPVPGPGTPITSGQGATFGCWHHHGNPWVPNPIPRNPWVPNPKRQNLWAPNLSHRNPWVPNPSHRPNRPHLRDAGVGPGGAPHTCLAFGRTKEKSPKCGSWWIRKAQGSTTLNQLHHHPSLGVGCALSKVFLCGS